MEPRKSPREQHKRTEKWEERKVNRQEKQIPKSI